MSHKVDGHAILELLAQNETEVARVYREVADNAKIGDKFFENLAEDEDYHHGVYLKLAQQAKDEGGWVVEEDDYDYFRLRLQRSLLAKPEDLYERATKLRDKMEVFELAERVERETVEIVRELREIVPRFAPEELEKIERQEKGHLKMITERIRDNFLNPRGL
ncbi:rubrerythrin [Peptoniphilus ivorii]|uniref:ferritin family protein n=1 Tax=Aedoeadaptatus ivorii TaxID=54006 RepID=UPI002787C4D6|nr:ferritin family protein [Peptoniphilus ivorii]MDQ0508768.1 rubrerythrin [Peptoniphilus ivorii]